MGLTQVHNKHIPLKVLYMRFCIFILKYVSFHTMGLAHAQLQSHFPTKRCEHFPNKASELELKQFDWLPLKDDKTCDTFTTFTQNYEDFVKDIYIIAAAITC